ncbi:hypothetical protein [Amnibacterium endophyticum]|uniref:TadE family protein n=1 Tax=Amnibacterium endophyticum TaxID=2109337 RepID=A0ABW4LEW4_9MICO
MPRSSRGSEAGSAAVEGFVLGVLLLVPLVYLVLTLSALQGAAFAAEGAARQAARSIVLAEDDAAGRAAADAAVRVALADWRVPEGAASVAVECRPAPDDCLTPRGAVRVSALLATALLLLPPAVAVDAPASVPVDAAAVQRVSAFRPQP